MATVQYNSDTENKCTVSPNTFTRFKQGTTITITANSGYHFTSLSSPYLSWLGADGSTRTTNMVAGWFNNSLSADGKTITLVSNTNFSSDIVNITCMQTKAHPIEPDAPTYPVLTLDKTNAPNVTFSPADNQIEITGGSQVLTISANSGYQFDGTPYIVYDREIYYFELSGNNYIFDLDDLGITSDSNAVIYASVEQTPVYPVLTLTKNLVGCSISPADNQIEITGGSQVLTISANSGYQFDGTPYIVYDREIYYFELSGNNYIFDLDDLGITSDSNAVIYASVEQTPVYPVLTLTKNLVGCSISPNVSTVEIDGTSKIFTITPDTQKAFKVAPKITINGVDTNFILSNGVYTLDFNTLGITADVSGTINATAIVYKDLTTTATNCVVAPETTRIFDGDVLALTATANNGYIFAVAPEINFNNRDLYKVSFTKVTDYQYTLSLTVDSSDLGIPKNPITITAVAIAETPIIRKYGTIQVYKPTPANMSDLSTKRFQSNGTVDGVTYNDIDLGQYITQFKRVFIDVVTNSTGDIYLGRHNTQINAPIVNDDVVTVDCGNVTLTGANGNELDTKIYKIFLVLTCYGITPLDSVYMNKTINIKYQCNIVTGYADIIISQVVENVLIPIQKLRCKISQDLPYIINVEQLKNSVDDDVYNEPPKIILQKQNVFAGNGYDTYKQNTINNETGYFIIDRFVNHSINAPENELNEIESLLKSGVTI